MHAIESPSIRKNATCEAHQVIDNDIGSITLVQDSPPVCNAPQGNTSINLRTTRSSNRVLPDGSSHQRSQHTASTPGASIRGTNTSDVTCHSMAMTYQRDQKGDLGIHTRGIRDTKSNDMHRFSQAISDARFGYCSVQETSFPEAR